MKENVREEERDMTTHLIKIPVFTHASCVTRLSFRVRKRACRIGKATRSNDQALYLADLGTNG